jgi:hypothetical protein
MSLDLDLSESREKLARACEHLHALNAIAEITSEQVGPYKGRLGEADPKTGWSPIFVRCPEIPKPTQHKIAALVGDAVYNIRCALDYIVYSLAKKSGASDERTQFPVFIDPVEYAKSIWRKGDPVGKGSLSGIKYGLAEIEAIQPYNTKPDPRNSPVWTINRFSNYDKHRSRSISFPIPGPGNIAFTYYGEAPKNIRLSPPTRIEVDKEIRLGEARFRNPPAKCDIEPKLSVEFLIVVGASGKEKGRGIETRVLHHARKFVYEVVKRFERL